MADFIENDPRPPHRTSPDPRRRYCVEHQDSECPKCYARAIKNPSTLEAFNDFLAVERPRCSIEELVNQCVRETYTNG